eukprot:SAG11_NODE_1459_length_4872_cov_4.776660_5_plen_126_part_00
MYSKARVGAPKEYKADRVVSNRMVVIKGQLWARVATGDRRLAMAGRHLAMVMAGRAMVVAGRAMVVAGRAMMATGLRRHDIYLGMEVTTRGCRAEEDSQLSNLTQRSTAAVASTMRASSSRLRSL